jgi:hypothetical protein
MRAVAPSTTNINPENKTVNHATSYRRRCSIVLVLAAAGGVLAVGPALAQPAAKASPPAAEAGGMKTVAVLSVASYDELAGDVKFLGSLAGQPGAPEMLEGSIALFTQGRGLASIDRSMPWGIILQTDGTRFIPVACLPVTKLDDLLQVAENYGAKAQDAGKGVKEISLPNGQSVYVTANDNWAFVAQSADTLADLPADPQKTLAGLVTDYDVALQFSVQNIPQMYRQMALAAFEAGLAQGMAHQQGTEQQRELQQKLAEMQRKQVVTMIQELDSVTIGWAIDAKQQNTYLDFVYRFVPGSSMAKQMEAYGEPVTNLAGFYQPSAALTMTFAAQGNPEQMQENIDQFKAVMAGAREQANQAIDQNSEIPEAERPALKQAASDIIDVVEATIESGRIDGGAALQMSPNSMTLVAAMQVQQPEKVEGALKKLAAAAESDPQFPGIQWNAASHKGVHFDTLRVPVPADEPEARAMLGDETEMAIGIGPGAVYLAFGRDWQSAVNQAIDASAAEPNKGVPPLQLSVSLGPIAKTAAAIGKESDRAKAQMLADAIQSEGQGRDHLRAVEHIIPNGMRLRIEVEDGVLRAIGKLTATAQQAQQGGMREVQ